MALQAGIPHNRWACKEGTEVKERLASLGAEPVGGTPPDLAKHISAETAKWKDVVRVSGAKVD